MIAATETVVFVHGLWMHGIVFALMRRRLERAGFRTVTWSYPSVRHDLKANAEALSHYLAKLDADTLHLVGHSLGGLVILSALSAYANPHVRRVVLMGAPCSGSLSATTLLRVPGLSALVGRSMRDCIASAPPPAPDGIEVGVIAGTRSIGIVGPLVGLPKPNDGVVMVDETRLLRAHDAISLPVNHTEMLFSQACANQVCAFLRTGAFTHAPPFQAAASHPPETETL